MHTQPPSPRPTDRCSSIIYLMRTTDRVCGRLVDPSGLCPSRRSNTAGSRAPRPSGDTRPDGRRRIPRQAKTQSRALGRASLGEGGSGALPAPLSCACEAVEHRLQPRFHARLMVVRAGWSGARSRCSRNTTVRRVVAIPPNPLILRSPRSGPRRRAPGIATPAGARLRGRRYAPAPQDEGSGLDNRREAFPVWCRVPCALQSRLAPSPCCDARSCAEPVPPSSESARAFRDTARGRRPTGAGDRPAGTARITPRRALLSRMPIDIGQCSPAFNEE